MCASNSGVKGSNSTSVDFSGIELDQEGVGMRNIMRKIDPVRSKKNISSIFLDL